MSSGIHRPPVAPKPKKPTNQGAVLSPHIPRRDGLAYLSPGTARKVKPPVAPKPSAQKPTATVESKSLQLKTVSETPRSVGLLNSQNGIQQNKKPEWDYIIPICLCSQENCKCISTTNFEQKDKRIKTSHNNKSEENRKAVPLSSGKHDNNRGKAGDVKFQVMNTSSTDAPVINHKLLSENRDVVKTLSSDSGATSPQETAGLPLPHRTQSDETNAGEMLEAVARRGQKNNCFGSEQASVLQHNQIPKPSRMPPPVPVQRKLQAAAPSRQEKVEDKREDAAIQEKREVNAKGVKMSSNGKGSSSLSVSVPDNQLVYLSARRACPPPASTPRKKPFHPNTTKAPTSSVQTPARDLQEEDLGSDTKPCKMVEPAYRKKEEMKKKVGDHQEETHPLPSSALVSRPDLSKPPTRTSTTEERETVEKSIKKHRRHSSTSALIQMEESIKEQNVDKSEDYEVIEVNNQHNSALKEIMKRELPALPVSKPAGKIKPSGSKLSKKKAVSFSSADILHSEGQKGNSFRKILELKLVKKKPSKETSKGRQNQYATPSHLERSAHKDQDVHQCIPEHLSIQHKLSFLQTGVEQSVDGDEFSIGLEEDDPYEHVPIYEEILDYENTGVGNAGSSPTATYTKDWQGSPYDDENIYEDQELYFPLVKNTHQDHTQTGYNSSVNEEASVLSDAFSECDTTANTSDEEDEDDSSSMSSKGDSEHPGEKTLERQKKKTKIQHIATEIMSSENVFVDVLKLLHVDFRNSVEKKSRQHGKPVIEEHLLNQILYYLPQLYELNKDLLKELRQRVAQWDENSQIADIFLKKGPFLKMYSTYIREFNKNAALLEEQTKKNLAFGAVVKEFQASPRCANLTLSNYLLKPVQRIPQYQLLLTDYLKNLSEDSNDYKDTQAALALVKEVASHANDIIKQGDNFEKLIRVQSCLSGNNHEIVQPGRIFLKEGALMKLSRKVMQPRMFFLFNDALLYTVPVQSAQYKLKNMLSLAGMKVSKPSQEAYQNELNIESVERSFILSASSASERDEWLETISTAISEYTKKKLSFASVKPPDEEQLRNSDNDAPLGSTAPIWIPDLRATMCMICTCEFTLTWRRHHCRACGKVVCQACSSNKYCLAYKKNQPARVCDQCFAILQHKSKMTSSAAAATGSKATFTFRKQKKIPAALKEVSANTDDSSMSGYLTRSKQTKKQGKRLWFVIKDKVLYTYAASEDVAALESQPLLGFILKVDPLQKQQFKLYHQNTLYYVYEADDVQTAQRWISSFKEATVL